MSGSRLLANAVKYNRPGGRVDVSFDVSAGPLPRVRTVVSDTGIGIQPGYLEKLFEPFERLGAEQRAIDGTGLGLTLSRRLIEAMGGTIAASSIVGIGSTFTIELALVPAPGAEHDLDAPAHHAQPSRPASGEPDSPKVLYIEDNVSNMRSSNASCSASRPSS